MIDISKLSKAQVLMALYNESKPAGVGFLHYSSDLMTEDEATALLAQSTRFDYLRGRVMKVNLSGDEIDPRAYDRSNGQGAVARIISDLLDRNGQPSVPK